MMHWHYKTKQRVPKEENQNMRPLHKVGPHSQSKVNEKNNLTEKKETGNLAYTSCPWYWNPKLTSTWVYRVFCKGKYKMIVVFKAVPCCKALHWLRDENHPWKNSNSIQASKNSYRWSSNTNEKCIVKQHHVFRSKASTVRTRRKKIEGRNRAFMYSDTRLKDMDLK